VDIPFWERPTCRVGLYGEKLLSFPAYQRETLLYWHALIIKMANALALAHYSPQILFSVHGDRVLCPVALAVPYTIELLN